MDFQLKIDDAKVISQLYELGEERQGPFILSRSLNLIAKQIQKDEQANLESNLHFRRKPWVLRQVKIGNGNWSTTKRLVVRIAISDAGSFLSDFELGAERVPHNGHSYMAIPNVDVFENAVIGINNPLRIKNLNLHDTKQGVRGDQETFIIHSAKGTPLIMQRLPDANYKTAGNLKNLRRMERINKKGRKANTGLRILYNLVKDAHVKKHISWYDTANESVVNNQYDIFTKVIREALADTKK